MIAHLVPDGLADPRRPQRIDAPRDDVIGHASKPPQPHLRAAEHADDGVRILLQ